MTHDFAPLHAAMQRYVDRGHVAGISTMVLKDGALADRAQFGVMDLDTREPLGPGAIFRIYSNTKIVTSVAALMLLEEGHFGLGDPVHAHLPELEGLEVRAGTDRDGTMRTEPCHRPMTIRQLMSHSGGFVYGWNSEHPVDQAYSRAQVLDPQSTLADAVAKLGKIPLAYQPGTEWRYSVSTDVLARLVEVLSGERFDRFLERRLFEPLGMADTGFHVPPEKQYRFVTNYRPTPEGLVKGDDPRSGQYSRPRPLLSGGGGLCSSIEDYGRFIAMLSNGGSWRGERLLAPGTVEAMRRNVLPPGVEVRFNTSRLANTGFGLGVAVRVKALGREPRAAEGECHWGGVAGTHAWISPKSGMAALCFTQLLPGGFMHPCTLECRRLAYRAIGAE